MSRNDRWSRAGHHTWRQIGFLVAGIGIGSAITLLSAPTSGDELRHTLGRGYRKAARKIGRHTGELRDRADEMLERSQDLRELGFKLLHFGRRHKSA